VPRVSNIVVQQRLTFCQSDWTFIYHGAAYGSVIADEREDGLAPWQGTELCTAVEVIFSQAYNYRALADGSYADSAELSAFNALPGGVTGDWWAHQYMSQANQPVATNLSSTPFYNTNSMGQTYVSARDTTVTGLPLTSTTGTRAKLPVLHSQPSSGPPKVSSICVCHLW
jgi:hypothetical protein